MEGYVYQQPRNLASPWSKQGTTINQYDLVQYGSSMEENNSQLVATFSISYWRGEVIPSIIYNSGYPILNQHARD